MRRVTLQFNLEDLAERDPQEMMMRELELFELVHILKQDKDEMAMIAKLKLKDDKTKIEDLLGDQLLEYQLLETDKDGVRTYFFRAKEQSEHDDLDSLLGFGGYLIEPFSIRDGKATITFLGNSAEIKNILRAIDSYKIRYKVLSLSDAKFSYDSPLSGLTEKQRRVIVSAFNSGYYEIPRRISSEELADKLDIRAPTLVLHRRKAEQRVLEKIING